MLEVGGTLEVIKSNPLLCAWECNSIPNKWPSLSLPLEDVLLNFFVLLLVILWKAQLPNPGLWKSNLRQCISMHVQSAVGDNGIYSHLNVYIEATRVGDECMLSSIHAHM